MYPLENRSFKSFDVIFGNTSEVLIANPNADDSNNIGHYTLGTYKTVDNEPHILTMTVRSIPTIDVTLHFDDINKCVKINTKPNSFVQKEGRACIIHRVTTEMIDTTRYNFFSVDEIELIV
jgi:hypothetical protein